MDGATHRLVTGFFVLLNFHSKSEVDCIEGHAEEVQSQLQDAMNFEGSDAEKQARIYLVTFGIVYDAITREQFVNIIDVLKLSKYMKSPTNQRGKARP